MLLGFLAGTLGSLGLGLLVYFTATEGTYVAHLVWAIVLFVLAFVLFLPFLWCFVAYRAFSYNGRKKSFLFFRSGFLRKSCF